MRGVVRCALVLASALMASHAHAGTIVVTAAGASSVATCTLAQAIDAANRANNATGSWGATPPGATTVDPLRYSVARQIGSGSCSGATAGPNTISLQPLAAQTLVFEATAARFPNQGWNDAVADRADNYWYGPNALPPIASDITIEGHGVTLKVADGTRRLRFFFVGADARLSATNTFGEPVTPGFNTPGPGKLTLRSVVLSGGRQRGGYTNCTSGAGAGMGGAIFNQGKLVVDSSVLVDNEAQGGPAECGFLLAGAGGMGSNPSIGKGGGMGGPVPLGSGDTPVGAIARGNFSGLSGLGSRITAVYEDTGGDWNLVDEVWTPLAPSGHGGAGGSLNIADYGGTLIEAGWLGAGGGFRGGHGGPSGARPGGAFGEGGGGGGFASAGGGVGGGAGQADFLAGGGGGFGGGGTAKGMSQCLLCGAAGFGGSGLAPGYGARATGAGMGGAIFNLAGDVHLVNATLSGNAARGGVRDVFLPPPDAWGPDGSGLGGAVFNLNGAVLVEFSTLAGNRVAGGPASDAGALHSVAYNADTSDDINDPGFTGSHVASVQLRYVILSGSRRIDSGAAVNDLVIDRPDTVQGGSLNLAAALIQAPETGARNLVTRWHIGNALGELAANTLTAEPRLLPSMDNGGATPTMMLGDGSPARDAAPGSECVGRVDQRGVPRPLGMGCDLGAVEQEQPIVVTTALDVVANDGLCALREALNNANGASHADCAFGSTVQNLVRFAPSIATITLGQGVMGIFSNVTVDGDRDGDGVPDVTVDAHGASAVFVLGNGKRINLNGLALVNGNSGNQAGGALRIEGADTTVTLSYSRIDGSRTTSTGGAIDVPLQNQLFVRDSRFENNEASGNGGAIHGFGLIDIDTTRFSGNRGANGGALYNGLAMTVARSTFEGNAATANGGAVRNDGFLDIAASTLTANTAAASGGALSNSVSATLTNVTLSANTATTSGGGVHNANVNGAVVDLRQATVADNVAPSGAGVANARSLKLSRSIVAGSGPSNCSGTLTDDGGNLAWGDTSCSGLAVADPQLQPLADNGGPTRTRLPGNGSALVDVLACNGTIHFDQRGERRPSGVLCDIGATESQVGHRVGGQVSGLLGTGLSLQLNGGIEVLPVAANGAFTFVSRLPRGGDYSVTVAAGPTSPWQTCSVAAGTGGIVSTDITGVQVTCVTDAFGIGGRVTGLVGSGLVLSLNAGAQTRAIVSDGPFDFAQPLASGSPYAVTIDAQPSSPAQTCSVQRPAGSVAGSAVDDIVVTCVERIFADGFDP